MNFSGSFDGRHSTIQDCTVQELSRVTNRAGNITVLQPGKNCSFDVPRIYYLYDVPGGATRGGHAHRMLHQLIVAASGSFDIVIDDGTDSRVVSLNRPYYALHVVPGIWRDLRNFSSGSICLVLASSRFEDDDYIREHHEYLEWKL